MRNVVFFLGAVGVLLLVPFIAYLSFGSVTNELLLLGLIGCAFVVGSYLCSLVTSFRVTGGVSAHPRL